MTRPILAVSCRAADLSDVLQESIDYYALVDAGAVQARNGATGDGRLWTDGEIAAVTAQLARLLRDGGPRG